MTITSPADLSDRELLDTTVRLAASERQTIAEVIILIGEVDARRLYLPEGCSSLFTYCTQVLHFSEHEAYHRIEAARAVRAIVERALALLVDELERRRLARVKKPRALEPSADTAGSRSRHVPAEIRRGVWTRDGGRCAFVGRHGRCRETGQLEFHHVDPFALGGATTVDNLQLRCRAHNQYEGALLFGAPGPDRAAHLISPGSQRESTRRERP